MKICHLALPSIRPIFILLLLFGFSTITCSAAEEADYFAVFMEGAKVGYAIHSRVVADDKVTTSQALNITVGRLGIAVTVSTKETCIETADGKPLAFVVEEGLGGTTTATAGSVSTDGTVTINGPPGQAEQKSILKLKPGAVMAEGLRLLALRKGMKEGTSYTVPLFSPSLMQAVDANITVGAKENVNLLGRVVSLTKVQTALNADQTGEVVTTSYVDDQFRELKSSMPIAGILVELVACPKEFALGDSDAYELTEKMFVASPQPLENVDSAKAIAYLLRPASAADKLTIPGDDNQRVSKLEDGSVMVVVEPVAAPKGAKFPYRGSDAELIDATKPTRFLQSNDKQIIELARRAVGDTKDAAEAAKRIEAFAAEYIEDMSLSVGYASAAEVAVSRQGDCSEFAVLTAAMCRAVGIPSRVVVGIAYVEDFGGLSGFGGHAWVQAYIGGKWVGLDAAFKSSGRGGYDAGHIALASGDGEPGNFFNMAAMLGRFKIEKAMVRNE